MRNHLLSTKLYGLLMLIFLIISNQTRLMAQHGDVEKSIRMLMEQERAAQSFWALSVRNEKGSEVLAINAGKLIRPASNLKLLTSAAILNELSPQYTFETTLYGQGNQHKSTWRGDLIIRGMGDPSISDVFEDHPFYVFKAFAEDLKQKGIWKIEGDIIGNGAYFDRKPYPKGWDWDDLPFYYGVEINALSFNNNCVDLTVTADSAVGKKPSISWFPYQTDYIEFNNRQVITGPGTEYEEDYRRLPGQHSIYLGSTLPRFYIEKECLSVPDPAAFFADTFTKYLEKNGITVHGSAKAEYTPRDWQSSTYTLISRHQSRPLSAMIRQMNRESDNYFAEMLLKTAAAHHTGEAGSTESGIELIELFAHEMGIDTTRLQLSDASGMSSRTLITTTDMTQFLHNMRSHSGFNVFEESLSISGVNGTLGYRMRQMPLEGIIKGKSGYVSGVRSISGYMQSKSGNMLSFSLVVNHYIVETSQIDRIQEEILTHIYQSL